MHSRNCQTHPIPLSGALLLGLICVLWGLNLVSIKVSNQDIPPIFAAAVRSAGASFFLYLYARYKGEQVFLDRADWKHGLVLGALFGVEFLVLYWGPSFTDASRAIIFLYTQPMFVALMAHFFIAGDSLTLVKSVGMALAFAGLIAAFGSRSETMGPLHWIGDLMEVVAGFLWAATTVYVKKFIWNRPITHFQTLFAQLFFSVPILFAGSWAFEWDKQVNLTPFVAGIVFYQTFVIAFMTYLLWFWMVHRYPVSRLAAFTFLVPLFGVIMSGMLLGESMTVLLWVGLGLVASGIYLVNRPDRHD
ncbi:MAG: DMT family transporter [Thermodesulfobacteriota bacterium]